MIFPIISSPDYPLKEELEDNILRSNFDDGSMQTRRKFTRSRRTFTLSWGALTQTEKDTLFSFYRKDTKGGALSFTWTNPQSGEEIEVRFMEVPTFSLSVINYWQVEIKLRED